MSTTNIYYRFPRKTDLNYFYITDGEEGFSPFIPKAFKSDIVHFFMKLPRNLYQLVNSEWFFKVERIYETNYPHFFSTIYNESIRKYQFDTSIEKNAINVFIFSNFNTYSVDQITKKYPVAYKSFLDNESHCKYLELYPDQSTYTFKDPIEFIELLRKTVDKYIVDYKDIQIKYENKEVEFEITDFRPTLPNAYNINQILTFYWEKDYKFIELPRNEQRTAYLINQIQKIDNLHYLLNEYGLKQISSWNPIVPPLILAFPTLNPTISNIASRNVKKKGIEHIEDF